MEGGPCGGDGGYGREATASTMDLTVTGRGARDAETMMEGRPCGGGCAGGGGGNRRRAVRD